MNSSAKFTALLVVFQTLVIIVTGNYECYVCTSPTSDTGHDDHCTTFNAAKPPPHETCTIDGPCMKTVTLENVVRSCSTEMGQCVESNEDGIGTFCCTGNKCNSGEKLYFSSTFLLIASLRYIM